MVNPADKCPKCRGALVSSYGEKTCINCGATPMTNQERHRWWQDNKKEIATDVQGIGAEATLAKWSIPRQLLAYLYRGPSALLRRAAPVADSHNSHLQIPPLPEFKDSWPSEVQTKWLDIWLYMVTNHQREEVANGKAN